MRPQASFALALVVLLAAAGLAGSRSYTEGYAGCSITDGCISFDLSSYAIGDTIDLRPGGDYPYDATIRPGGREVWICGAAGDSVMVIDRATNAITHRIPVGEYPNSIVFTDDGDRALVSARDGDLVTLISTSSYVPVGTLDVTAGSGGTSDGPGNMALDRVTGLIYAVDWYGNTLFEIASDGSSVLNHVDVGSSLWQLVVDPLGRYVYLTDRGADVVRVITLPGLVEDRQVPVGNDPWGIDVTLDGSRLVVACEDDHNVHVIDTSDWSAVVVALGADADPRDVDILDAAGYAFVAGGETAGLDPVYVITLGTNQLKDTIGIGGNVNVVAVQEQTTSALVGVPEDGTPPALTLECFPNPFNPEATVRYHLPAPAPAELAVYDAAGRLVARLEPRLRGPGLLYEAHWDGTDGNGRSVAAGVYFVDLKTETGSATAKVALVK
ncbi:MAG: FlgD immunoglobulin-like domain containing protein [Candidatus Eisenbacteria bacterium]